MSCAIEVEKCGTGKPSSCLELYNAEFFRRLVSTRLSLQVSTPFGRFPTLTSKMYGNTGSLIDCVDVSLKADKLLLDSTGFLDL